MSTFGRGGYQWRETYFVLFDSARRPTLTGIEDALAHLKGRFELANPAADEEGRFESVTLLAPDEHAAVDVSYLEGEDVMTERARLLDEMKGTADRSLLARLLKCNARLDVMHFQQMEEGAEEEDDDVFDPSALLLVLDVLVKLTGGVGVDPQSGTLM
jgi:hypothetical protein